MALIITEIYPCLLGESTHVGRSCVLVRLTGCNLRCRYCDSEFAFYGGAKREVEEVCSEVLGFGLPAVLVTGGEPLLQREVFTLVDRLIEHGANVLVETGGSLDIGPVNPKAITILDIKCPDSGESHRVDWGNLNKLRPHDEVKFVVSSRADYEWAKSVVERYRFSERTIVLVSPAFGQVDPKDLAEWILQDRLNVRLHLQMHKYIWEPNARGV